MFISGGAKGLPSRVMLQVQHLPQLEPQAGRQHAPFSSDTKGQGPRQAKLQTSPKFPEAQSPRTPPWKKTRAALGWRRFPLEAFSAADVCFFLQNKIKSSGKPWQTGENVFVFGSICHAIFGFHTALGSQRHHRRARERAPPASSPRASGSPREVSRGAASRGARGMKLLGIVGHGWNAAHVFFKSSEPKSGERNGPGASQKREPRKRVWSRRLLQNDLAVGSSHVAFPQSLPALALDGSVPTVLSVCPFFRGKSIISPPKRSSQEIQPSGGQAKARSHQDHSFGTLVHRHLDAGDGSRLRADCGSRRLQQLNGPLYTQTTNQPTNQPTYLPTYQPNYQITKYKITK